MIKCLATNTLNAWDEPAPSLEQVREQGYSAVHLALSADLIDLIRTDESKANELVQICGTYSITVAALSCPSFDLLKLSTDFDNQIDNHRVFATLLKIARLFTPTAMVVFPTHPQSMQTAVTDFSYEGAFNCLFRHLEILAGEAQKQRVNLALENPSRDLLLSPLELRDLIDQLNSPHLGLCFNPHHAAQLGAPLDWARTLNHRIFTVKLSTEQFEEQIAKDILTYLETLQTTFPVIYSNLVSSHWNW